MALYQSTFRRFDAPSCKVTPMVHPSADGFHHLDYSMQVALLLDPIHAGADCLASGEIKPKSCPGGKMPTGNHRTRA